MEYFGLKLGQDLENRAAHPYQKFRGVLPPPPPGQGSSNDETTAFADDPLADAEWTVQYEKEMEKEKELEQELTERLQGSKPVSEW